MRHLKSPRQLNKPPIVPKFPGSTKKKGTKNCLEPPSAMMGGSLNAKFAGRSLKYKNGNLLNNSKSAKFLKNIQSIPKSAGLKGITMSDKDVPNLKDSIKISINSGVLTNFSSSLKSIKPLDNSQGYKTLSKIMEASSEANESQEKKTIMLNNLSDDGSEYDNTIKHDTTKHMEQVDEVIEDLYDLFLMIGCSIIEELPEEINIKVHSTGNIIKVSKVLFTQFTAGSPTSQDESCSPAYNIVVASSSVARRESRDLGKVQLVAHPKSINTNFTQENDTGQANVL